MKEGELDWKAAKEKVIAAQIESNMTAAPLLQPLTREQRAMALRSLESGRGSEVGAMLGDIAKGLMHDYGEESLDRRRLCHCGARAHEVAGVDWEFHYVTGRELDGANAVTTLLFGVVSWKEKTISGDFSTFHPVCSTCADSAFNSKASFERLVERVPSQFKQRNVDFFEHPHP